MRMTRAALRAQEAEEDLKQKVDAKIEEQQPLLSKDTHEYQIHEDSDKENSFVGNGTVETESNEGGAERPALRDITEENYPTSSAIEPELAAENDQSETVEGSLDKEPKSQKKAKSKKGKKGTKKNDAKVDKHPAEQQLDVQTKEFTAESKNLDAPDANSEIMTPADSQEPSTLTAEPEVAHEIIVENSSSSQLRQGNENMEPIQQNFEFETPSHDKENTSNHEGPETPAKTVAISSKTPKFNPEVHLPIEHVPGGSLDEAEDSFVDSIKTRSPSKLSQSLFDQQDQTLSSSFADNTVARTPSRTLSQVSSTSPQRIEDSVEAIDALEDAIEKFAEDLPVIQALPFESPVRSRKSPARTPAKTPAKMPTPMPSKAAASTPVKLPATRTPLRPTPALARASSVHKKAEPKASQAPKDKTAPARKEAVKDRVRAIESKSSPSTHRRTTSAYVAKKDMAGSVVVAKPRHAAAKSVSSIAPSSTMSFSNSPLKQTTVMPNRRTTSGAPLVTSKPGFAPAKSTKPVTKSTFTLPGEAVAAKLKAQREERQKREEAEAEKKKATFKARPAPAKTARPSVPPRENKTSTARVHVRQASSEDKENVAPRRPSSMIVSSSKPLTDSKPKPLTATPSAATATNGARRTTIAPRPTSMIESRKPKSTGPAVPTQTSQRIASLTSGQPITVNKTEAAQQRVKGKEVYSRIKGSVHQLEEERKAKEDAAKKARAEAAERGRQASREWAEKQRLKMANAKMTVSSESKTVAIAGGGS